MARSFDNPWLRMSVDAWSLGIEAATVIGLRTMKIAAGGAAGEAEVRRMIDEKIDTSISLQVQALTGGLGFMPDTALAKSIAQVRRKVRANRRRLVA